MISGRQVIRDIKPVLSGYIAESLQLLKSEAFHCEDAVHDIRVLMKKSRAVMKLVSDHVDSSFYEKEYYTFREAGRLLAEWRETVVHRRTLKAIKKSNKKLFARLGDHPRLAEMMAKPVDSEALTPEDAERKEIISGLLTKSYYRIRFYNFGNPDFGLLFKSLDRTYRNVSEIYLECRNNPKPARLHTFRKRVKDFLYQVCFFRPLNPPQVKKLEKRLYLLAQKLGK